MVNFQDGLWCAVEILIDYHEFSAREIIQQSHISRDEAIKLSKVSGYKPSIISDLDAIGTWKINTTKVMECKDK